MPYLDAAGTISVEALRAWWGALFWAAAFGLAWVAWVWTRVGVLRRRRGWTAEESAALGGRLRDASYRVLLKAALLAFVALRWDIFQTATPSVLDGRQTWDAAFLTLVILLLDAWSLHQFVSVRRRPRGGPPA